MPYQPRSTRHRVHELRAHHLRVHQLHTYQLHAHQLHARQLRAYQHGCRRGMALLAAATARSGQSRPRFDPEHPCVRAAARRAGLDVDAYLAVARPT